MAKRTPGSINWQLRFLGITPNTIGWTLCFAFFHAHSHIAGLWHSGGALAHSERRVWVFRENMQWYRVFTDETAQLLHETRRARLNSRRVDAGGIGYVGRVNPSVIHTNWRAIRRISLGSARWSHSKVSGSAFWVLSYEAWCYGPVPLTVNARSVHVRTEMPSLQ